MIQFGQRKSEEVVFNKIIDKYNALSQKALVLHTKARCNDSEIHKMKILQRCLNYWQKSLFVLNEKKFTEENFECELLKEKKFCEERIQQVLEELVICKENQNTKKNIEGNIFHYIIEKNVIKYITENNSVSKTDINFYIAILTRNKATIEDIEAWLIQAEEKDMLYKTVKNGIEFYSIRNLD